MNFEKKILELNLELPDAKAPVGNYVATKIIGKLLYISGQISISDNGELIKGKIEPARLKILLKIILVFFRLENHLELTNFSNLKK